MRTNMFVVSDELLKRRRACDKSHEDFGIKQPSAAESRGVSEDVKTEATTQPAAAGSLCSDLTHQKEVKVQAAAVEMKTS